MKNIFYLPNNISLEKAKELYKDQENRKHSAYLPYLYYDAEAVYKSHRSFKNLLETLQSSCTVILWDVKLISMPAGVLAGLVAKLKHRDIKIRILNPVFTLDPDSPTCEYVLNLLEAFEEKKTNHKPQNRLEEAKLGESFVRAESGFGYKRTNVLVVEDILKYRRLGYSVREIAKKCNVSVSTAFKYSKGLPPIRREMIKERVKRNHKSFDLKQLQKLPKCEGRLNIIIAEFIKVQRTFETRKNYFNDLSKFASWAVEKGHRIDDPSDISLKIGLEYKEKIEKRYAPSVVRRFVTTLNVFLNYCVKLGYLKHNSISAIKLPIIPRHNVTTEAIKVSDLTKIIKTAHGKALKCPKTKRMTNFRNYLGILLLSTGGMRLGSLLSLRVKDVKPTAKNNLRLNMEAKRSSKYSITIDDRVADLLKQYIHTYFRDLPEESFLFFSRTNDFTRPMTTAAFNNIFRKLITDSEIKPEHKISPHSLRVSYATLMFEQGMSLKELSYRLNHKNIAQTAAYIKIETTKTSCNWLSEIDGVI
ncbi:MAG: tyrosine-type recombinase/integrase [Oligoflexales bacterium]